ncbi:MAG: hypothetical protein IKK75_14290 [Clostridia bacterium]|nr:hypothetical protein [Clostridia bacterium]
MPRKSRKIALIVMLVCVLALLCGCKQNPSEERLYARMTEHFAKYGYPCSFSALEDGRDVPIYQSSAWKKLMLGQEEVLVYFDESNRADYLSSGIDAEKYGFVGQFGLRFVLVYSGADSGVLEALNAMPEV